ncbi:hypothetical protein GOP47_0013834 [Adiantum capillus-veneris]|uniref:Uncharacterized protein n=1 Tax=Adiantum capillus-veneris TaxID=13818 RepID=A0A9D4UQI1_ADICA|nr:hypothetical protein GOP47_0013834 [Adiantum capillus-veneris]
MDVEKLGNANSEANTNNYFFFFNRKIAKGGWRSALLILGVEVCERLATLGIGMNLVLYLHNQMHLPIPTSANAVTNFFGASFITCLLGGFVADTYLGRYGTIIVGASIQLIGIILMVFSATLPTLSPPPCEGMTCKPANTQQQAVLFGALYLIALGTGGVKSCVSGLGADQFNEEEEEGRKMMQSFFNWFGVGLSMASVLAVTVLAYLQDNMGHGVGYSISAACITLSLSLFLLGSPLYNSKPPIGSPLSLIARIFLDALRNRHLQPPPLVPNQLEHDHHPSNKPSIIHTKQFLFLDKAALSRQCANDFTGKERNVWIPSSLERVEEVKKFLRLLPILATTIIFWTGNAQMITFSTEQAATLDRRLGKSFSIPPTSLHVFVQLGCIITLIFYDKVMIPIARKWRRNDEGITSLQRIGIGLFFAMISMVVASFIERKRLKLANQLQLLDGLKNELPLSAFYLTPQYCLVGIGEAFGYIGQLEFFFTESPDRMRSLGTGLSLSTISLGFFLSSALVDSVNRWTKHGSHPGWITNDLNTSRLDYFYLFIAFCSLISFLAYLACSYWYVYDDKRGLHKSHSREEPLCNSDNFKE